MKRLCIAFTLLLSLTVIGVTAAPVAQYAADGSLAAITEPGEDILPLIFCRSTDDLTAAAVTWGEGHTGQGVTLDGVDAYFRSDGTLLQEDALSFALWINWQDAAAAPAGQRILSIRGVDRNTRYMALSPNGGERAQGLCLEMQMEAETVALAADTPAALAAGWHHLAVVWEGNVLRLYMDGVLLDEKTAPATPAAFTPRQLCWGKGMRAGETGYLRAQIDEVYQYNRALTAEEIRTLAGVTAESTTAPTQTAPATPTQPSTVTPDPLEVPARLWWLLIPVVAVVVLLLCLRPWKHRRSRYGKRYSFKR